MMWGDGSTRIDAKRARTGEFARNRGGFAPVRSCGVGRRELLHPHETEQPFTRELYGVEIPKGVDRVVIRARHEPKGYDGKTLTVDLPR
jgi:hypothetical protein